jgi:hypothetical protein
MSYIVITVWELLIRTIYLYQAPAVFLMKTGFQTKAGPFLYLDLGEITPRVVGTLHQASGNHFIGCPPVCLPTFINIMLTIPQYQLIEDNTCVKDVAQKPNRSPCRIMAPV